MHEIKPITPVATMPSALDTHIPPQMPAHKSDNSFIYLTLGIVLMAILGTLTGWGLYSVSTKVPAKTEDKKAAEVSPNTQTEVPADAPDAEGLLEIESTYGQGVTHKIGDVYLLSSLLDLDGLVGKKVKVWGSKITTEDTDNTVIDVGRIKEM